MSTSRILTGLLKTIALFIGGLLTIISLMAILGLFIGNGWAQLGIALVVALGIPALIADRVLPSDAKKSDGVVSDVYSLIWVGFALLFVGLSSVTGNMLRDKAADFHKNDKTNLAALTMWVAGPGEESAAAEPIVATTPVTVADAGPAAVKDVKDASTVAKVTPDASADAPDKTDEDDKKTFTPAALFKEMSPAVVTITVHGVQGMGGGTGFIVDKSGIVITNEHVINDSTTISVKLLNGTWASKVELLVADEDQDLAVLKITTDEELHSATVGDSDSVQVGERAISIGNPLGLEHTLTDGLVSARRTYEGKKMIQMSTPVSPGNSGGPLFNLHGEVIGVSTAQIGSYRRGQNLNLAIPINQAKAMLTDDYPDRKRVGGGSPSGKGSW
jgi:V8-like Glu-specific endopeptidase